MAENNSNDSKESKQETTIVVPRRTTPAASMLNLDFDTLQRMATALYKSGFFGDIKNQAQAIVKVMAGQELGIPPFASMTGIHIIKGVPSLGATLVASLVDNHPRYDFFEQPSGSDECILEWTRDMQVVGISSFSLDEAEVAGLMTKDNWRHYPSDMLFARALTRGARRFSPGIFSGAPIYTPDELGAVTDIEGHTIDGVFESDDGVFESEVEEPDDEPEGDVTIEEAVEEQTEKSADELQKKIDDGEIDADTGEVNEDEAETKRQAELAALADPPDETKGNGKEPAEVEVLRYRNNHKVDMTSEAEVGSFNAYIMVEGHRPPSKVGLRKWYKSGQPQS